MRATYFGTRWFQWLTAAALVMIVSGSIGAFAQVSAPAPSRAQVIAQGIQWIEAGEYAWQMETATAGPQAEATSPAMVSNGFIYATGDPVLVHEDYRDFSMLSSGQARWAPADIPTQITTVGQNEAQFSVMSLTPTSSLPASQTTESFAVEQGDYNVQLTRGILTAGEQESFTPANTLPWFLVVLEGEVSLAGTPVQAGNTATHTGDAAIVAGQGDSTTYLVVSIGERVELPQPPAAAPGEVLVLFWDCAETDFPVETREQCEQVWEPISASFTMFSQGTPLTRTDATQLPDGSWIYETMTAGEWEFQLFMPDGSTPPTYTVLGDAEERDGQWYVTVNPGERSVANVMMYRTQASALTVTFMECPEGWDPSMDMAECTMAANEPAMRVEGITGQDVVLNTQVDATMSGIGTYEFQELPAGVYLIEPEYNDTWTPETTYFLDGAYTDAGSWYVEVTEGVPASVLVVRTGPLADEGVTPPTVATGYVVITQEDCDDATAESACVPSADPWDVRLTNIETGEIWWMSEWGYNSADGQWTMQLPTGSYTVEVPDPSGWQVEYPGTVDVLNDQESYISVRGNP
jgi:hypothetical protein